MSEITERAEKLLEAMDSQEDEENLYTEEQLWEAFEAGHTSAKYRGNPVKDLRPITRRAARSTFEQWKEIHLDK